MMMGKPQMALKVGDQVNIKRSDGRIHGAVISGFNHIKNSVTVEWFELEETKGKEIEVATILALNPEFTVKEEEISDNEDVFGNEHDDDNSDYVVERVEASKMNEIKKKKRALLPDEEPNSMSPLPLRPGVAAAAAAAAGSKHRRDSKSKCVLEVERVRKKREERRAKQGEQRHAKVKDVDANNPNYEFERMIEDFHDVPEKSKPPKSGVSNGIGGALKGEKITVCIRKRPINKKEKKNKEVDVIHIPSQNSVTVHEPKLKVDLTKYLENHDYTFDRVFDETCDNKDVYTVTAKPLIEFIFQKGRATCFAYGQTGSGKTYTMGGDVGESNYTSGIYAMAANDVFSLNAKKYANENLSVFASFFEIYSGKVFDLLNSKKRLRVLEDGKQKVQVVGLQEVHVSKVQDIIKLIQEGNAIRTSGTTSANRNSSRSHAVFQIILKKKDGKKLILHGKFSLIDLAGNERGCDTADSCRQTRMEGAEINKSLLALKECIRALGKKGSHTPFRASKLTQVLRDSFIGNMARTVMIATVSPGANSCEHSLNTLRYADRVKELKDGDKKRNLISAGATVDEGSEGDGYEGDEDGGNDDLTLLHRSLRMNNEESRGLLMIHKAVTSIVEEEEEFEEEHRRNIEKQKMWIKEEEAMLDTVDSADCDLDSYTCRLDDILADKMRAIGVQRDKLAQFRKKLVQEEDASKSFNQRARGVLPIY